MNGIDHGWRKQELVDDLLVSEGALVDLELVEGSLGVLVAAAAGLGIGAAYEVVGPEDVARHQQRPAGALLGKGAVHVHGDQLARERDGHVVPHVPLELDGDVAAHEAALLGHTEAGGERQATRAAVSAGHSSQEDVVGVTLVAEVDEAQPGLVGAQLQPNSDREVAVEVGAGRNLQEAALQSDGRRGVPVTVGHECKVEPAQQVPVTRHVRQVAQRPVVHHSRYKNCVVIEMNRKISG